MFAFIQAQAELVIQDTGQDADVIIGLDNACFWPTDENVYPFILMRGQACVGYMTFTDATDLESGDVLLDCIDVAKEFQGLGLGTFLIRDVLLPLVPEGSVVSLYHRTCNKKLAKWYTGLGFKKVATLAHTIQYGVLVDYLQLRKSNAKNITRRHV
jgi:ribosomal protein S18 acetylase RimI-like enzyme